MKKQMNGWKVISFLRRQSARSNYGNVDRNLYVLKYPVGVKVTPKDKNSRLFFFANELDADRFRGTGERVVPCIATGVSKIKHMCYSREDFADFWKNKKNKKSCQLFVYTDSLLPYGTFVAKSITCLK